MNIKITENILIDGQHTPAGEVIDIDEETANKLILMKRAEAAEGDVVAADAQAAAAKGK